MSTLNYTPKNYEQIFYETISDAQENNLISNHEEFLENINNLEDIENVMVLIFATQSKILSKAYEEATKSYISMDLNKATDTDLDRIGAYFNITRPPASKSIAGVTFTIDRTVNQDIIIPEGVIVQTNRGEQFIIDKNYTIPAGATSVNAVAKSVLTGYESRVGQHTLNQIATQIETYGANITCDNISASTVGKNKATDEEYRLILKNWTKILSRGTKSAYEHYLNNSNLIDGYKLIPHWDGAGTLKIVIDAPTEVIEEIISTISEELTNDVHLYADDDVIIEGASLVYVTNIKCTVNVDIDSVISYSLPQKEDIALRVKNAIKTFIDGGYCTDGTYYPGLKLGEDFIFHKCAVFIDKEVPEVKNVKFNRSKSIVVEDYEKAESGEINVLIE